MAAGGHWGIGTDSNIQIDAAGELRQLEYAQRLSSHTRNALSTPERPSTGRVLFQSALAGGAQALGQRVGLIAPGYRADLLVLDERHPDLAGRSGDAVLDTWIFAGGRALIREVIAAGETVVEQHRHRARDRIDRAYRDVAARLMQSPTP
jgi:cytosine/adenosine deaminase-related metal-dependent hydrolase